MLKTYYSTSCCVDEVAAEHLSADLIVHYGRSCLSQFVNIIHKKIYGFHIELHDCNRSSRIPVLYVYGRFEIDIDQCVAHLRSVVGLSNRPLVVLYDVVYEHAIGLTYVLPEDLVHS